MKLINVKAAGMFTPQEEGPCKLTLIIPQEDKEAQNFAFTKLRYQDVVIGLASEQETATEKPMDSLDAKFDRIQELMEDFGRLLRHEREEVGKLPQSKAFDIFSFKESPLEGLTITDPNAIIDPDLEAK